MRTCLPERRAIRSITRSEYWSSLLTPRAIWNAIVAAAAQRAPARAQPKLSTTMEPLIVRAAIQSTPASRTSTAMKPLRIVSGSRIRATTGTISALRTPMTATTPNAPSTPSIRSPGSTSAAVRSPAAASVQPTSRLRTRNSGRRTTQADARVASGTCFAGGRDPGHGAALTLSARGARLPSSGGAAHSRACRRAPSGGVRAGAERRRRRTTLRS